MLILQIRFKSWFHARLKLHPVLSFSCMHVQMWHMIQKCGSSMCWSALNAQEIILVNLKKNTLKSALITNNWKCLSTVSDKEHLKILWAVIYHCRGKLCYWRWRNRLKLSNINASLFYKSSVWLLTVICLHVLL